MTRFPRYLAGFAIVASLHTAGVVLARLAISADAPWLGVFVALVFGAFGGIAATTSLSR